MVEGIWGRTDNMLEAMFFNVSASVSGCQGRYYFSAESNDLVNRERESVFEEGRGLKIEHHVTRRAEPSYYKAKLW